MRKLSRRHKDNLTKTNNIIYSNIDEAIAALKDTATTKFVESVELHANLDIDPKYADLEENTVGCTRLPHGRYQYQIHLKKQLSWQVNEEKRRALLKFLDTNVDSVFVSNGLLIDWLEGKDTWYPASYFYVTDEKYLSPLYVIAGDMIDKVIQFKEIKNAGNKKTTRA